MISPSKSHLRSVQYLSAPLIRRSGRQQVRRVRVRMDGQHRGQGSVKSEASSQLLLEHDGRRCQRSSRRWRELEGGSRDS